jgi:hypothetical protein
VSNIPVTRKAHKHTWGILEDPVVDRPEIQKNSIIISWRQQQFNSNEERRTEQTGCWLHGYLICSGFAIVNFSVTSVPSFAETHISLYLLHNVSTLNQCRKFPCVAVVCKHFASYSEYPVYKWNLIR